MQPHNLNLALDGIKRAASDHAAYAKRCEGIVNDLTQMVGERPATLDVEALAEVLIGLDLCIVHRGVVRQSIDIVKTTQACDLTEDGLDGEALNLLQRRLELALVGRAK
jgi:hypothetical protein